MLAVELYRDNIRRAPTIRCEVLRQLWSQSDGENSSFFSFQNIPHFPSSPARFTPQPNDFIIKSNNAFFIFLAVNSLAAIYSPILDCDETYNYWEPTHFLNHGYGMQTWEYSPEYAIRSWLYAAMHAFPLFGGRILHLFLPKFIEFYFLRILFAYVCAACETRIYVAVSQALNPRIGFYLLTCLISSAGMFHASVAYLPSSFAMYCIMLALSSFLDRRAGSKTARGIMFLAVGTILGWPFVAVLCIPFVLEQLILCVITGEGLSMFLRLLDGLGRALFILAIEILFDSTFYKKLTCVPFNLVWYNVLSRSGKGPDIFGIDPWHWYFRNLLINFNIWFILALICLPLVLFQFLYRKKVASRLNLFPTTIVTSLFYLWLAIFTFQPHKEERFMYPLYPCLALNASVSVHILLSILGVKSSEKKSSDVMAPVKFGGVILVAILTFSMGLSRMAALTTAYSAPVTIYSFLDQQLSNNDTGRNSVTNVCVGKEWYRFPTSYFLPTSARLKFIKSEFSGLLPGAFQETDGLPFGIPKGIWTIPPGMNDENKADPGKLINVEDCDYLVDAWFPGNPPTPLEPDFILDKTSWRRLKCEPFLHGDRTHLLGRLFWLPDLAWIPSRFRRRWGQYCLLQRRVLPARSSKYVG